eukprot:6177033-Lingulodinium_polyedra.AAC.1
MLRKLNVNIEFCNDPSHGAWRDVGRALGDTGLTSLMKLMMVTINVPHGPWSEDTRWKQCQQALEEHFEHFTPLTSELFRSLAPGMLADQVTCPDAEVVEASEEQLWQELRDSAVWRKKGAKVNWNRFMGTITEARHLLPVWHMMLFGFLLTCLELDMLRSKHVKKWNLSGAQAGEQCEGGLRRAAIHEDL